MAMIRSLPDDYASFVSSLLVMDKLEKSAIHRLSTQRKHKGDVVLRLRLLIKHSALVLNPPQLYIVISVTEMGIYFQKCYKYLKAQKDAKKPRSQKKDKARAAAEDVSKVQESAGVVSLHTTTHPKLIMIGMQTQGPISYDPTSSLAY